MATSSNGSTYTLRVSFTGLCGFIPRGNDPSIISRMDVILPEADYDLERPHIPTVSFYLRHMCSTVASSLVDDTQAFWVLEDEDVRFSLFDIGTGEETELEGSIQLLGGRKSGDKPFLDTSIEDEAARGNDFLAQMGDFSWVPRMKLCLDAAGDADPELVDDDAPGEIKARVYLSAGCFGTHALGVYQEKYIVVAEFAPSVSDTIFLRQALAHWAGVDIEIESRFGIVVRASKYEHPESVREMRLRAIPGEDVMKIEISNSCCGIGGKGYGGGRPESDTDFEYLYKICANYEDLQQKLGDIWPIPVPVRYPVFPDPDAPAIGGVEPARCTGGRFEWLALSPLNSSREAERLNAERHFIAKRKKS